MHGVGGTEPVGGAKSGRQFGEGFVERLQVETPEESDQRLDSASAPSRIGLVRSSGIRSTEPMPAIVPLVVGGSMGKSARTRWPSG